MARSLFGHFALATLFSAMGMQTPRHLFEGLAYLPILISCSHIMVFPNPSPPIEGLFFAYTYHLQSHSVILIVSLTTYTQPLCLIFATN